MWDVKDALLIRAGWKVSSGIPLCWKMLILQNWNISQEHVDFIESFNGKQACRLSRKPALLVACQPGLPGSPLPRKLLLQLPDTPTRPLPWEWGGWGEASMKGGGTDSQVGSLAAAFLWKFSFLYKNTNSSGKITINSFHRREILFSRLIYQWGDTASLCFLFAYASHILTNMILGGRYPVCSHWNSNAAGSAWGVYSLW